MRLCLALALCLLAAPAARADQRLAALAGPVAVLAAEAAPRVARAPGAALPVAAGAPVRAAGHGVLYAARGASGAFGLAIGAPDRLTAHREAERACAAQAPGCRPVAEFDAACGAAAQSIRRSHAALFGGGGAAPFVIGATHAGGGATQPQAERSALAECQAREPQGECRIAASGCAGRG